MRLNIAIMDRLLLKWEGLRISRQPVSYQNLNKFYPIVKRYLYSLMIMGRPLFLMGTIPLYALGITAAWHDGKVIQVPLLVSGLFLVWLIQLMTHYNNEYCDLETDPATEIHTRISGGSRALVKRLVPRITARIAALACLLLVIALYVIMVFTMHAEVLL